MNNLTQERLRNLIKLSNYFYEIPTPTRKKKEELAQLLSERLMLSGKTLKNKLVFRFAFRDLSHQRLPVKSIEKYLDDHIHKDYKVKETFLQDRKSDAATLTALMALPTATLLDIAETYNSHFVISGHIEKFDKDQMDDIVEANFKQIEIPNRPGANRQERWTEYANSDKFGLYGAETKNDVFSYSLEGKKPAQVRRDKKKEAEEKKEEPKEEKKEPTGFRGFPSGRRALPVEVPLPIAASARALEKAEPPPPQEVNTAPPANIQATREHIRELQIQRALELEEVPGEEILPKPKKKRELVIEEEEEVPVSQVRFREAVENIPRSNVASSNVVVQPSKKETEYQYGKIYNKDYKWDDDDEIDAFIEFRTGRRKGEEPFQLFINKRGDVIDEQGRWFGRYVKEYDAVVGIPPPNDLELGADKRTSIKVKQPDGNIIKFYKNIDGQFVPEADVMKKRASTASAPVQPKRPHIPPFTTNPKLSRLNSKYQLIPENVVAVYNHFGNQADTAKYFGVVQQTISRDLQAFTKKYGISPYSVKNK